MKRKKAKNQKEDKPSKKQKTSLSFISAIGGWVSSFFEEEKEIEIEKEEEKQAENTFFPFENFPEELLIHIGGFLPSYHYMGKKSLPLVCNKFKRIFHGKTSITQQKRTKENIMKSCHTLEDTLHVFSDPTLCKQFSFEELMSMAGKHPQLALRILKSDDITFHTFYFISRLAQHDLTVAQTILNTPSLHREVSFSPPSRFDIIGQLNQSYPRFRKMYALFASPNTPPLLQIIVQLGQYHPSIAWKAFTPDLENNLASHELVRLAPLSPDILQHIMETPVLFDKIDHIMLPIITRKYPEIAMQFFKGERILSHPAPSDFDAFYSKCLLATHLDIAREVIAMGIKKILAELNDDRSYLNIILVNMANHLEIVWGILNNAAWRNQLNGDILALLGNKHLDVAKYILDTDTLAQKLNNLDLVILGRHHAEIAWRVFDKLELKKPLHTDLPPHLWMLFKNHPAMIRHVLNTPHLRDLIPANAFGAMCQDHLESLERVEPTHIHVQNCNALIKLSQTFLEEVQREAKEEKKKAFTLN